MNFFEEFEWRDMLHDFIPGAKEETEKGMCTAYIGFDPTAPSLTIGNYVQIMALTLWQRSGHRPIVLMGGATGRIGDPSGKDKERELKSLEEIDHNLRFQKSQMEKFMEFGSSGNQAVLRNNYDFYKDMNVLDFLRSVGKTLTINYMMSKDSVKNRLDTGMSFTEFSYQLLQSYDFQVLYQQDNCAFQMGGSDQWGNITSGVEFIRRNLEGSKAYAVTSKLLTKSDGKKFGKSEQGNIWLDPEMTSPYQFYQFWINADDADVPMYLKYFSLKSKNEVLGMINDLSQDPRQLKSLMAEEITKRIHSDEAFEAVKDVSEIIFNRKLDAKAIKGISAQALKMVSKEIPSFEINKEKLQGGLKLDALLTEETGIFSSLSEYRRAIKGNAVSLNKVKVTSDELSLSSENLLQDAYIFLENGKKNKFMIRMI
ncbi:MAG: tyrosine--tRNA ligase [Chitinophagia bacterium]|nr:tyrosine--tRNA ligase [Chitinophagia bacterium]